MTTPDWLLDMAAKPAFTLAATLAFILAVTIAAGNAQTYSVVYTFGSNGANDITGPFGLIVGQDGNLYGAATGANSFGELFKITPQGTATTLHNFACTDGSLPTGLTFASDGNLYGTTGNGHACGYGSVFKLTPNGTFTTLGAVDIPLGPPVQGTDGNLYGTGCGLFYCYIGYGYGTIYSVALSGAVTSIYEFDQTHGAAPNPQLLEGTDGNFYGTTGNGGTNGDGVIFKVTPTGQLTVLYDFTTSIPDPNALIQGKDGDFYGTTVQGGNLSACPLYGCGTIFKIASDGSYSLLYAFDVTHGMNPGSVVQGTDGNFYGTAGGGTSTNCNGGCGVAFKITPEGAYSVLHNFDGTHGASPSNLVLGIDGNFYGTTATGGGSPTCCGTIFQITPTGDYSVLHNFDGANGATPEGLVPRNDGNFVGLTVTGGPEGAGCSGGFGCGVLYSFVVFDFSVSASTFSPSTITPGGSSRSTVNVAAINGFSSAIALSCSVQPTPALAPKCSISPSSAAPGTPATLTVSTTAPTMAGLRSRGRSQPFYAFWLPLAGLAIAGVQLGRDRRERLRIAALLLFGTLLLCLVFTVACRGGSTMGTGSSGTPAGTYTVTVTGTSGFLQHSTTTTLTVQ